MKRNISGLFSWELLWGAPAFVFLTALFVCGAVAGCFTGSLAASSGAETITRLADSLAVRLQTVPDGRAVLCAALGALGWQAAAGIAGALRPASLFVPLVCAARGFTLSFSAAALLRALGTDGMWYSLASSGAAAVITVPCLLLTASACFAAAQETPRGRRGGYFYALGPVRGAVLGCTLAAVWAGMLQLPVGWIIGHWIL